MRHLSAFILALVPVTASASAGPRFEQVFTTAGEPAFLHYSVLFVANGGVHRMDVWRDRDRHVKRVTDRAVTSFATRRPGEIGYRLVVLDAQRRISTLIDRTNMYRIGNFTDWFDLAHGLRHPKGTYRLVEAKPPTGISRTPRSCRWYDLTEHARTTHVCWDAKDGLPLLIASARGRPVWRIVSLDTAAIPASMFIVHDEGYTHNDANQDIERD